MEGRRADPLTRSGATFANCPTEVGARTADGTLLLLLATTRGLTTHFLNAREGVWRDHSLQSLNWRGLTLGIIGLGSIGFEVGKMAAGLGYEVIYSNRTESERAKGLFEFVSRDELYRRADVVMAMTPLNDETRHMIDRESIAKMKDGVVVVNTCGLERLAALMAARGPVVNEADLVEALESGKGGADGQSDRAWLMAVLRAGLDVFETEPDIHPGLKSSRNVVRAVYERRHC